jgi:hypothetical protein
MPVDHPAALVEGHRHEYTEALDARPQRRLCRRLQSAEELHAVHAIDRPAGMVYAREPCEIICDAHDD